MTMPTIVSVTAAVVVAAAILAGTLFWRGGSRVGAGTAGMSPATLAIAIAGGPARLAESLAVHWRDRSHGGGGRPGRRRGDKGCAHYDAAGLAARTELVLSAARGYLRITPKQTGEWHALAQVVRDEAARLAPLCARWQTASSQPLAQQLAVAEEALRLSAAALGRLRPALDALYRELDPVQKRLFDRTFRHSTLWRER